MSLTRTARAPLLAPFSMPLVLLADDKGFSNDCWVMNGIGGYNPPALN